MAQNQQSRIMYVASQAVAVHQYLIARERVDEEVALAELGISRSDLYRQLHNLKDRPEICKKGRFNVFRNDKRLTDKQLDEAINSGNRHSKGPHPIERVLYLYQYLQNHTHSGGVDLTDLMSLYRHVIWESEGQPAADDALKRMIYRDIKELEKIHIPITRPANGQRYALINTFLPKMKQEHNILMYVSTLLFKDTLLDESTSCVRDQMEKVCHSHLARNTANLQKRVRVVGDTLINPGSFCGVLETLINGLVEQKALQFQYLKLDGSSMRRTLEPLGLICKRGVWYLVGMDRKHNKYKTFRIDQIASVKLLQQTYNYPEYFNLDTYLNNSWGVFNDDELTKVIIRFKPEVAERLKIVRYQDSQVIQEIQPDGSIIVEYKVSGLIEMKSWIMQWGDAVEVISPQSLRGQIREQAKKMLALYK